MYPIIRTLNSALLAKRAGPLELTDTDKTVLRIWPNDLDAFLELNNGRTITLYDIGRTSLALRTGLITAVRQNHWGLAVAGSFVRYRKRVTVFQKLEMRTRLIGRNGRFILMEQAMWRGDTCTSHMLVRTVVTSQAGVVDPADVLEALGSSRDLFLELPDWEREMVTAEDNRPWPPQF